MIKEITETEYNMGIKMRFWPNVITNGTSRVIFVII